MNRIDQNFKLVWRLLLSITVITFVGLTLMLACTPTDECDQTLQPGDDRQCSVGSDTYYVYAPMNYKPSQPTALIVDAHGAMESAEEHAGIDTEFCANGMCWPGKGSGWRLEADMPGGGFIVITPQGSNNTWSESDEEFILDAVAHVKTIANIDPSKVYITGISNGAALTYWAGCPNTNVFSGMSPVSGGADCRSIGKAIPVITFDAKPDFAYETAVSASDTMVDLNNCRSGPTTWLTIDKNYTEPVCRNDPYSTNPQLVPCSSISPAIEPTVCKRWTNCDRGVEVVFCDVAPGNSHGTGNEASDAHILYGNDSHLNLPSLAWRFFKSMPDGGNSSSSSSSSSTSSGGCR
jgi:poly(3-hydroxybutyrate) depolymerase